MEKGFNLQVNELKENITKVVNEANLPITTIQMALFELSTQAGNIAAQTIEVERKAYEETLKKGADKDGKEIRKD